MDESFPVQLQRVECGVLSMSSSQASNRDATSARGSLLARTQARQLEVTPLRMERAHRMSHSSSHCMRPLVGPAVVAPPWRSSPLLPFPFISLLFAWL
jgi:hypothetical protein